MANVNRARPPQSLQCLPLLPDMPPQAKQAITFHHPGYKEPNILLTLRGYDTCTGDLHHETARVACAIIANNSFDGYLSGTPGGPRLSLGPDEVLRLREYYFIVPGHLSQTASTLASTLPPAPLPDASTHALPHLIPYPIVPSFSSWRFPHHSLPPTWAALPAVEKGSKSNYTAAIRSRDNTCRMTQFADQCEVAHICPAKEGKWFSENSMVRYIDNSYGSQDTNDVSNLILLRSDLHGAFDQREFVFAPKYGELCTHVLGASDQYRRLFHNTTLHTTALGAELLFARFAWSIFPRLGSFLTRGAGNWVAVRINGVEQARWAGAEESAEMARTARGQPSRAPSPTKSGSPTKRKRDDDRAYDDDDLNEGQKRNQGDGFAEVSSLHRDEERRRCRKRQRCTSSSSSTLALSESPPSSSDSKSSTLPPSDPARTRTRTSSLKPSDLIALRDAALAEERARSDPANEYGKERAWAFGVLNSGGKFENPCPASYQRLWSALGGEIFDEREGGEEQEEDVGGLQDMKAGVG